MDPELGQTLGRASLRTSCGSCGARRASATRQTDLELGRVLGAIPAVRELLKAFASPAGAVITVDALHTQSDTARAILGHGADSVMTGKANMPTLHRKLRKLPWAAVPAFSSVTTGHGRRAGRTIKVTLVHAWIEFDGAAQVAQVRRTVTRKGRKTVEVVYLITSDRDADPVTLAAWARGHREIENRLHRVRDVTYQEGKSLVRTGNAPRVMASLRSFAVSILRLDGSSNIAAADATTPEPRSAHPKAASSCMNPVAVSRGSRLSSQHRPRRRQLIIMWSLACEARLEVSGLLGGGRPGRQREYRGLV
jgi:predicted transposase YbfD/YdcC